MEGQIKSPKLLQIKKNKKNTIIQKNNIKQITPFIFYQRFQIKKTKNITQHQTPETRKTNDITTTKKKTRSTFILQYHKTFSPCDPKPKLWVPWADQKIGRWANGLATTYEYQMVLWQRLCDSVGFMSTYIKYYDIFYDGL